MPDGSINVLSPTVRAWVAEHLALGEDPAALRAILVGSGLPALLVDDELATAATHPYLHAARRCVTLLRKRESLLNTLDRFADLDPDRFRVEPRPLPPWHDFKRDHVAANRPGLFRGAFDHWPARAWTPRTLEALVGPDTEIEVEGGRDADSRHLEHGHRLRRRMRFGAFVDHVEHGTGNDIYLTANNFAVDSSPFGFVRDQVGTLGDGYLEEAPPARSMFLWMGPAGIVTGMHQDLNHILFCQISGRKTFRLYPAVQVPYLYNHRWVFSPIDPRTPDERAHPLFARARGIELTVEAGDLLYIPIGWWHHVTGDTASISLSLTGLAGLPNHFIEYPPDLPASLA